MNTGPMVYLVDDDAAILRAVSRLLRAAGYRVSAFESPRMFLAQHDPELPGCVVLDVAMPEIDGLALQEVLDSSGGERQVVFVTGQGDIPTSVRAMRSGAVDFLTKPFDESKLLEAIDIAIERDRRARGTGARRRLVEGHMAALTPRERQVLDLVVKGLLNKQIAAELGTSEKTIKVHRARMMEKMQVGSVAELVRAVERAASTRRQPVPTA